MSSPYFETLFGRQGAVIFQSMFRRTGNLFSHEHVIFADVEGKPAGMILCYGRRTKQFGDIPTALHFLREIDFETLLKLPLILKSGTAVGAVKKGEFYISNMAVYSDYRGRGIAAELIGCAALRGRQEGAERLTLEVEQHNDGAIGFYEKCGFAITGDARLSVGEEKLIYYMAKRIK